jgi:hypothetical protein
MVYAKASWDDPNMHDYPFLLQAVAGADPISYDSAGWREPLTVGVPGTGVAGKGDFIVTQGAASNTVDVSAGAIVAAGATGVGKYAMRSTGTVNVPTPGAPGSGTRNHLLVAQALDTQHSGYGATPGWQFLVAEDTGSGATAPASSEPIATLTRTGSSSTITITDARRSCHTPMSCQLNRFAAIDLGRVVPGFAMALHFLSSPDNDDPWRMANLAADDTAITVRTNGLYDLYAWVHAYCGEGGILGLALDTAGLDGSASDNARLAATSLRGSEVNTPAFGSGILPQGEVRVQTHVPAVKLDAGQVVRAWFMGGGSGTPPPGDVLACSLRVARREIRP